MVQNMGFHMKFSQNRENITPDPTKTLFFPKKTFKNDPKTIRYRNKYIPVLIHV